MTDNEFDAALVAAVFAQAGERGWARVSIVEAARAAALDLSRARARFPTKLHVLIRFGSIADQAALAGATTEGPIKDRLFDIILRRFDVLQAHRAGVIAVLDAARFDPALGLILTRLSTRSMGWLLEGAGIPAGGLRGLLRTKGLLGVWLYAVRTWTQDDSPDLTSTMTATDKALDRAGMLARYIGDKTPEEEAEAAPGAGGDELPFTAPPPGDATF
ncbi:TetR family transcriptional regulator [Acidisoma silvae]|uniref:TetR family transcriptional regulator n=1 Tax=Acidisoma silvae TaxID=2802396 RepID=A0A963YTH6_9PROT|nr:TetR family transcriptional regulator [Acidisoma silvae]MCB8876252.1 TetR family transcriptional regulator [Acidisoma silvae]